MGGAFRCGDISIGTHGVQEPEGRLKQSYFPIGMRLEMARSIAEEKRYCAWKYPKSGKDLLIYFSRIID